jgi:hypothetical protein
MGQATLINGDRVHTDFFKTVLNINSNMMKLMMFSHWPTFLIFEKKQFELYISVRIQYKPYQIFECRNQTSFLQPPSERSSGKGKNPTSYIVTLQTVPITTNIVSSNPV